MCFSQLSEGNEKKQTRKKQTKTKKRKQKNETNKKNPTQKRKSATKVAPKARMSTKHGAHCTVRGDGSDLASPGAQERKKQNKQKKPGSKTTHEK